MLHFTPFEMVLEQACWGIVRTACVWSGGMRITSAGVAIGGGRVLHIFETVRVRWEAFDVVPLEYLVDESISKAGFGSMVSIYLLGAV